MDISVTKRLIQKYIDLIACIGLNIIFACVDLNIIAKKLLTSSKSTSKKLLNAHIVKEDIKQKISYICNFLLDIYSIFSMIIIVQMVKVASEVLCVLGPVLNLSKNSCVFPCPDQALGTQ